jgi:repressor LexA
MTQQIKLPLTQHQQDTLYFIVQYIGRKGYPPTIKEICLKIGFKNPGYAHKILLYLTKKGYLTKRKGEHRGVRLTELSENVVKWHQQDSLFPMNEMSK